MNVICPKCENEVDPKHIDVQHMTATCTLCDETFSFNAQGFSIATPSSPSPLLPALSAQSSPTATTAQAMYSPAGISATLDHGSLVLSRHVFSGCAFMLSFCLLCPVVLMYLLVGAALSKVRMFSLVVAELIWVAVFLTLIYYCFYQLTNRITLRVSHALLSVRVFPLFWTRKIDVDVANIEQLYCTQQLITPDYNHYFHYASQSTRIVYDVEARLHGGNNVTLLASLSKYEEARFFELQVEAYLGIADCRVPGEAPV